LKYGFLIGNPSIGPPEERYKEKVKEALKRILDLE